MSHDEILNHHLTNTHAEITIGKPDTTGNIAYLVSKTTGFKTIVASASIP